MDTFSTPEDAAVPKEWSLSAYQPSSHAENLMWIAVRPPCGGLIWEKLAPKGEPGNCKGFIGRMGQPETSNSLNLLGPGKLWPV